MPRISGLPVVEAGMFSNSTWSACTWDRASDSPVLLLSASSRPHGTHQQTQGGRRRLGARWLAWLRHRDGQPNGAVMCQPPHSDQAPVIRTVSGSSLGKGFLYTAHIRLDVGGNRVVDLSLHGARPFRREGMQRRDQQQVGAERIEPPGWGRFFTQAASSNAHSSIVQ